MHREKHGTLDNTDLPKLFAVQLNFMNMNKNAVYNEDLLDKFYLNDFWQVTLNNEKIEATQNFKNLLDACLKIKQKRFGDLIDSGNQTLLDLIEQVKKDSSIFGQRLSLE